MVYDQFDKAFSNVTAYALVRDGVAVGRVVLKHGAAVTAYVQVWGAEMTKGQARGGGYDRATAAFEAAIAKLFTGDESATVDVIGTIHAMQTAVGAGDSGERWTTSLERAGFTLALVIG